MKKKSKENLICTNKFKYSFLMTLKPGCPMTKNPAKVKIYLCLVITGKESVAREIMSHLCRKRSIFMRNLREFNVDSITRQP